VAALKSESGEVPVLVGTTLAKRNYLVDVVGSGFPAHVPAPGVALEIRLRLACSVEPLTANAPTSAIRPGASGLWAAERLQGFLHHACPRSSAVYTAEYDS
jgi:hypothetical protein